MPLYWSRLSVLFVGRLYLYWRHKNVKPVCDFLFIAQWSSLSEAWRRSEGNLSQWVNLSVTSRVLFVVYSVQCSLWSHVLPVQCVQWQQYGCTAQCTHHRLLHPSEPAPVQRSVLGSLLSQGVAVTELPYSVITDPSVVTLWHCDPWGDHCDVWHADTLTPGMWSIDVKLRGCVHSLQVH